MAAVNARAAGRGGAAGPRWHTPLDATMDDVTALRDRSAELDPGLPRFVYGHSLGGLIVPFIGIKAIDLLLVAMHLT